MQVIHSLGHVRCNSYNIWELKTSSSIVKEVKNTPSMHEFWQQQTKRKEKNRVETWESKQLHCKIGRIISCEVCIPVTIHKIGGLVHAPINWTTFL